jgi:hypothetical protein
MTELERPSGGESLHPRGEPAAPRRAVHGGDPTHERLAGRRAMTETLATAAAPDPNSLSSTMAQSAAVIVAIVAGFIITRVMALATERAALETRVAERREDVRRAERSASAAEAELKTYDASDFKRLALSRLEDTPGSPTFEEIVDDEIAPTYLAARDAGAIR